MRSACSMLTFDPCEAMISVDGSLYEHLSRGYDREFVCKTLASKRGS
jgi:hypothetical protein